MTFTVLCHAGLGLLAAAAIAGFVVLGGGRWLVPEAADRMAQLLIVAAAFALPTWTLRTLGSVLVGLDAMPREAFAVATASIVRAAWLVAGAASGMDVVDLLVGASCIECAAGLFRLWLARTVFGSALLRIDGALLRVGRELFGYSLWVGLQRASLAITNGLDRLLVGALFGPASVPAYWLCMRIVRLAPGALGAIGKRAVLPIASELRAGGGDGALHDLALRGTRAYTAFIWTPMVVIFLHAAPLLAWLGGAEMARHAWAVQVNLAIMALVIARGVFLQVGLARTAVARDSAMIGIGLALLQVGFLLLASRSADVGFAMLAWSGAHALLAPLWALRVAGHIGLPVRRFWIEVLRGGWPSALVALALVPFVAPPDAGVAALIVSIVAASTIATVASVAFGLDAQVRGRLRKRLTALGGGAQASSASAERDASSTTLEQR